MERQTNRLKPADEQTDEQTGEQTKEKTDGVMDEQIRFNDQRLY